MSDIYTEMQGVASELLTEFQQGTTVLVRSTPTVADPARPFDISADGSPLRIPLAASASRTVEQKYVTGSRIKGDEQQVTIGVPVGLSPEPCTDDQLEIDGVLMTTVDMRRLPAAGVAVAFVFFVRA